MWMGLVIKVWEEYLATTRSPKTREVYEDAVNHFLRANRHPNSASAIADLKSGKRRGEDRGLPIALTYSLGLL